MCRRVCVGLAVCLATLALLPTLDLTQLYLCLAHCSGNAHAPCVHAPAALFDARPPARRAAEAVAWFRSSVYGPPLGVATTWWGSVEGFNALRVVFGPTNRDECAAVVYVPPAPAGALLAVGGLTHHTVALAAKLGLAPVSLPHAPPAACGAVGGLGVQAEAANAVAAALAGVNRSASIYGCSRGGKAAVWAAATSEVRYDRVLADSPGALVSSLRQVQRCGEPFGALVDRWSIWLAANASAARDVRTWPANVDAGDLVLGACTAGTRYAFSSALSDYWNNALGLRVTVAAARAAGCVVDHVEVDGAQHCELFL